MKYDIHWLLNSQTQKFVEQQRLLISLKQRKTKNAETTYTTFSSYIILYNPTYTLKVYIVNAAIDYANIWW